MVLIPKNAVLKVFDSSFKICDNEYLCFNVKTIKQPQSISSFLIVLKYFRFNFGFFSFLGIEGESTSQLFFNCACINRIHVNSCLLVSGKLQN